MSLTDQFYEFAFEQLPLDDEVYVVVDVFNVDIEKSRQPRWSIRLEVLGKTGESRRFRTYKVHGTFLHKFILGELYQNQCRVGSNRREWEDVLECDLENQTIVFRSRRGRPKFHSLRTSPTDIPYVKIPLLQNKVARFAFVRCHEIFRFYYGSRLSILEYIYEFTDSARNPKLYNAGKTFLSKKEVHIFSGQKVHQGDVRYIGNYIYDPRTPKAIAWPAISARIQNRDPNFEFIQPIALAPLWYPSKWKVDAQLLDYEEDGQDGMGLMISRIQSCKVKPPYLVTDYKPSRKKKDPLEDHNYKKRKKKRKLKRSKITTEPFGDDIEDTTPVKFDDHIAQPGFAQMEYTKVLSGEKEDRTGHYNDEEDSGNDKSSTNDQGGGNPDTDKHNPILGRPTTSKYEEEDEEEPDRSHLPSLFDSDLDQFIEGKNLAFNEMPAAIKNLKSVVIYMNKNTELRAYMLGDERGELGEDKIAVLDMPNEWLSKSGKANYNTAVGAVIVAEYKNHYFYYFELVQNFETSHFMQAMLFPGRTSKLDIFEMSVIFREKLKAKKHWPKRKEFCDDFYASRIAHRKDETISNFAGRMRDHAFQYLLDNIAA